MNLPKEHYCRIHKVRCHTKRHEVWLAGQLKLCQLAGKFFKRVQSLVLRNQGLSRLRSQTVTGFIVGYLFVESHEVLQNAIFWDIFPVNQAFLVSISELFNLVRQIRKATCSWLIVWNHGCLPIHH